MADKPNTVASMITMINKKSGVQTIRVGHLHQNPARYATGWFAFDLATGGGVPKGRVSIFYGAESSLKTSAALLTIAAAQRETPELKAVFVDLEGTLSLEIAKLYGVNVDDLVIVEPSSAEQAVDLIEGLLQAEDVSIVVVDSIAAMITEHELSSDADKAMVGTQGIIINKLYRKVTHALNASRQQGRTPTLLVLNQIRMKVGVMFGDPETQPGGNSFKFASSLTVRFYGKDEMKESVSKVMPAFKKVSCIIKKWKVPIVQKNFEMMVALMPNEEFELNSGEVYDWNTVLSYLKNQSLLVPADKKGYALADTSTGETELFPTQDALYSKMKADKEFNRRVRLQLIAKVLNGGVKMMDPE